MHRKIPIFYSALLLTGVNLLLRMAGTSFQVYLSGKIGPGGIGLLQLVMSVSALASVAGIGGIRTAAMYLTAEELGHRQPERIKRILSACFCYSIVCSTLAAGALSFAAPWISVHWIGNPASLPALRLYAAFLPAACLCAVMTGYFTGANRIGTLAAVEVAEQLLSMALTLLLLKFRAGNDPGKACLCVVLGSSLGCCLTLGCLIVLRLLEHPNDCAAFPIRARLLQTAAPLAAADLLRSGISTTENLLVPKRLSLFSGVTEPLAAFGLVCGMVFPIMMFPACILFGLAELLIPELARCAAAGNRKRIVYLVRRSLRVAMLYGAVFSGVIFLLAKPLCLRLYHNAEAGSHLRMYALILPFLYCDIITDAMTKGLGQQKVCVRYNILTSSMDVALLFFLLPRCGMRGYFVSFVVTHLLNFGLSLRHLCRITGLNIPLSTPLFTAAAALAAIRAAAFAPAGLTQGLCYLPILGSLLCLLGVVSKEDLKWVRGLVQIQKKEMEVSA